MKQIIAISILSILLFSCNLSNDTIEINSPDKRLKVIFYINNCDKLCYKLFHDNEKIIESSLGGIIRENNYSDGVLSLMTASQTKMQDNFIMFGNHSNVSLEYTEMILPVFRGAEKYDIIVRAYNEGIAVRSKWYNKEESIIMGDEFNWSLPDETKIWFQDDCHSYEGLFTNAKLDTLTENKTLALPITAQLPTGKYMVLTEADVINYSDLALKTSNNHTLKSYFHANPNGWKIKGDVEHPWRVVLIAEDLNKLVNNDILYSLAPPSRLELKNENWIKPGRATWQWWSSGEPVFEEQSQWIEWTSQLGFEYYLVDDGWKKWSKKDKDAWGCLKEVTDIAKTKNIGVWLWVHSNEVDTPEKRNRYFGKVQQTGIVGVKIDFMPPASTEWINWYDETLQDAAKYKLMINFHGAVKPSGRNRTWPHEMTREGVRGHEWHILRYNRTLPASHDCILPFNRYIQGFADYTPTVLNPNELRGFTWCRELAQAVIFTSPFLCYADRPDFYLKNEALNLIKEIPSTWDETIVLSGSEIGECVSFARRKKDKWFVAVINGNNKTSININFSFLNKEKTYKFKFFEDADNSDDCFIKKCQVIKKGDNIKLNLRPGGGFIGMLE